jgi:hypothetical protein
MSIRRNAFAGVIIGVLGLGCAAIYPEVSTPIGKPPNENAVKPEPPDDYVYLYFKSARMPPRTRDGRPWGKDKDSLPSPYAVLFMDGVEISRTEVQPNTLEPTWPQQKKANYRVHDDTKLKVEIWDDHGLFPHPICQKEIRRVASHTDLGEVETDCNGGGSFVLAIEPAHAFWGLGLYYELRTSAVIVSRVVQASAAGWAGLKPGDQIVAIMDQPVSQLDGGQIQTMIRVNASKGLELKVRTGEGPPRNVTLKEAALYPLAEEKVDTPP